MSTAADRPGKGRAEWMSELMTDLYPLCRSITGYGTRATLDRVAAETGADIHEVPTGTRVLDWSVPDEWLFERALLIDPIGDVVVDSNNHNLHVVGYSEGIKASLTLDELLPYLHSLPDRPGVIPFRTSYYERTWGFCLPSEQRAALRQGTYEVEIIASLEPGALVYGELVVPGRSDREFLVCTHICHPSLANDNLTGIAAAIAFADWVSSTDRRLTYRFLFLPATIGAISWLARNQGAVDKIVAGLVIAGIGDQSPLVYKRSRRGSSALDRLVCEVMGTRGDVIDWSPYGYDERQLCSPGFDLPVGRLSRAVHGTYPEYHTSADDLGFIDAGRVSDAVDFIITLVEMFEARDYPRNRVAFGEPQLGRRGLYTGVGGSIDKSSVEMAYLWLLSLADGDHDIDEIARRSDLPGAVVQAAAERLRTAGLLEL